MWCPRLFSAMAILGLLGLAASWCPAQQVTIETPYNATNDSFFENFGTNWGFNWRGANLRVGGSPNQAAPGFGGFDPSAGFNTGFGFGGRGFNGFFNMGAAQGFRQSFVTQAPVLTLMNGQTGFVSDSSMSPFVIGQIPVVGGFPTVPGPPGAMAFPGYVGPPMTQVPNPANDRIQAYLRQMAGQGNGPSAGGAAGQVAGAAAGPVRGGDLNLGGADPAAMAAADAAAEKLAAAQSSSAGRPVPSVAEARRLHEIEQQSGNTEGAALMERAMAAEDAGKPNVAKVYYRMVVERATGDLRKQAQARLGVLASPGTR